MLNNQIIVTDDGLDACAHRNDHGVIDAALLAGAEWQQLRERSARAGGATKARLIKCAKCWLKYGSEQWLSPKVNHVGTRILAHQAGEGRADHDYEPVETPEHRAYNNRAFRIGDDEGYNPRKEAWASNMKTRADVLLTGTLAIAYEHQHSPFSATGRYSAPERTRLATAVGRTPMWHATSDKVRGQVPILRTDGGLPPQVIENPNYRHEFRGGVYRIEIYTCDVRWGHECPDGKFSGCGKPHARGQVTAANLDDIIRGAPVAKFMPMYDVQVIRAPRFFWTDAASYVQYLAYVGAPLELAPQPGGALLDKQASRRGLRSGHSQSKEAQLEALREQAVVLSRPKDPAPVPPAAATAVSRPTDGSCSHWVGAERRYCRESVGVRHYLPGMRCPAHTPARLKGQPEPPEMPGWGAGSRGDRQ
ncbi:hypothetical protein RVR_8265 [Actinacidiphila reveromycinica]|uniref:Uncharacterized protein n=1 Tax=Actinacidiphila reveromycinica TaxID=659352 RepID=A0A7U3UYD6_9ACTN|nr:hypothetical protein [Streptomyces sp. SN-593]BBB01033.1 hypothetical protein RVR_8265 [Streptomyces sp. SN-593]